MSSGEDAIKHLLARNVEEVIDRAHLEKALLSGKKLRVKLGIDPTSPDLHLGHAVVLRKLKEFQDLGHRAVLIIGDFTARIGDPSGKSEARKPLSEKEIKENMRKYLDQAGKILSIRDAEIRYNGEWFGKEKADDLLKLAAAGTMQQMLRREDFKKRVAQGGDVTVTELLYPLFQGYDSVKVEADVELGGNDQLFNLLAGRKVQRRFGVEEQDILTVPLLEGTDGEKKMSKSVGNYIGLTDEPADMFGKIMSVPDKLVHKYFMLCTDLEESVINKLEKELPPRGLKARLGSEVVRLYHGEKAAKAAEDNFNRMFSKKEMPADLPELKLRVKELSALEMVLASGTAKSKSEARRLIEQGGFEIDGAVKKDAGEILSFRGGEVARMGKKKFFRIVL